MVGIDTAYTYERQHDSNHQLHMYGAPTGETTDDFRRRSMNYTAYHIIQHEMQNSGGKFIALVGNLHTTSEHGVPGLAELTGAKTILVDPCLMVTTEIDYQRVLTIDNPGTWTGINKKYKLPYNVLISHPPHCPAPRIGVLLETLSHVRTQLLNPLPPYPAGNESIGAGLKSESSDANSVLKIEKGILNAATEQQLFLQVNKFRAICQNQIDRLHGIPWLFNNAEAEKKREIIIKAKRELDNSTVSNKQKLRNFYDYIVAHRLELQKPHSSISKSTLKGVLVFVGIVMAIQPGILLGNRFFGKGRPVTTNENLVKPVLLLHSMLGQ